MQPTSLRVHQFLGLRRGPRLLVTAAVHGNETSGTLAIPRVIAALDDGALKLLRGTLTFVPVVNPKAYELGTREGDRNLNRDLRPTAVLTQFEDGVANQLCPLLAAHDVLLDLHSFNNPGAPFVMLGPRNNDGDVEPFAHEEAETRLALSLGVSRVVEGWLSTYVGGARRRQAGGRSDLRSVSQYGVGTTEYMRSQGGYGVTLECGQHGDPMAVEVAHTAILNTLSLLNMVEPPAPYAPPEQLEVLRMFDVVDRDDVGDAFMRPWSSFDAVGQDTLIARRRDGTPLVAPCDGRIIFPNDAARPGEEWFYLTRASDRSLPA